MVKTTKVSLLESQDTLCSCIDMATNVSRSYLAMQQQMVELGFAGKEVELMKKIAKAKNDSIVIHKEFLKALEAQAKL
jgi:hypothetical protein